MKSRRAVALLVLSALLALGIGGCHASGGPCCRGDSSKLVAAGSTKPCCVSSAPPALRATEASAKAFYAPALTAGLAVAPARLAAAAAVWQRVAVHTRPLFRLDCTLRL